MAEPLSAKRRKKLPRSAFAIPTQRDYPIPDASHARNALARVSQNGTPAEQKQVARAVARKFPSLRRSAFVKAKTGNK